MKKRILSVLLAAVMLVLLMPIAVSASENSNVKATGYIFDEEVFIVYTEKSDGIDTFWFSIDELVEYGKTYTLTDMNPFYSGALSGNDFVDKYSAAQLTVTKGTGNEICINASCTLKNGNSYSITYTEHAITNNAPEADKESNYGFVSIDKSAAAAGETVTVTINPDAGYGVDVFQAKYKDGTNKNLDFASTNVENVFTFVMPAFPVNITVSFIPHDITVSKIVGGETVPATVGNAGIIGNSSFLNCDCYWSQNTLVLNADGLIVSGNGGEIDSLHISDSSSVKSVTLKNFTTNNTVIIRNGSDAFTLKLEGDNYIGSISDGFYTASEGIVFDCGKLTITGSGNLTIVDRFDGIIIEDGVTGADLVIDENFTGKLTVKDAGETEEEQSEEPPPPCAISIGTGDFIISGGTIELTSDEKNGITAGCVAINGGTITVKGGLVASSVAPILTSSMKVASASVNFDGTSPVETYSETDIATYKYIKIEPIHTHAGIKQNGQAATKDAAGFKEYYKCDCGKYFEDENCESEITDLDTWKAGAGKLDKLPSSGLPTGAVVAIVIVCVVAVGGAVYFFVFKKKKS